MLKHVDEKEEIMLSTRFTTALSVATELHIYQERKGKGEPYTNQVIKWRLLTLVS